MLKVLTRLSLPLRLSAAAKSVQLARSDQIRPTKGVLRPDKRVYNEMISPPTTQFASRPTQLHSKPHLPNVWCAVDRPLCLSLLVTLILPAFPFCPVLRHSYFPTPAFTSVYICLCSSPFYLVGGFGVRSLTHAATLFLKDKGGRFFLSPVRIQRYLLCNNLQTEPSQVKIDSSEERE